MIALKLSLITGIVLFLHTHAHAQALTLNSNQTASVTKGSYLQLAELRLSLVEVLQSPSRDLAAQPSLSAIYDANSLWKSDEEKAQRSVGWPIAGGLFGAAIGIGAGGLIGLSAGKCQADFDCELRSFLQGASVGSAVLVPAGAHLGNARRGNFSLTLLSTVAVTAAGIGVSEVLGDGDWLITIPFAQIITGAIVERKTSR